MIFRLPFFDNSHIVYQYLMWRRLVRHSSALSLARIVLRVLIAFNWMFGVAVLALLIATIVAEKWTFTALGVAPTSWIPSVINGLRAVAVLGVAAVPLNYIVLSRLLAIVATVCAGDPFISANAVRLQAAAWAMLTLQLFSLVIGAIGKAISTPAHPIDFDAGFSVSGWLAVLLTFVMARVFAEGARMRDDLEGTV